MTVFLACLSAVAVVVSLVALGYSRNATASAERAADAAQSTDRQGRTPQLDISLLSPAPSPSDKAIYRVRNDGPQDLSAMTVFRPRPPDRITYPLAITGQNYADDGITFSLNVGDNVDFIFCCGTADHLPLFRVRIECESGPDRWTLSEELPPPRGEPRQPLGADPARARESVKTARGYFQDAVTHGGKDQSFWLDPDRQGIEQELQDNAARVGDPQLRSAIEQIAATWNGAWASSPRRRVAVNLNEPEDPARLAQFHASEEAAQKGLDQCAAALAIFNRLEAGSR